MLLCTPYRHDVNYGVFLRELFSVPCRRTMPHVVSTLASLSYKFSPWHPEALRQLPRDLLMLFPAIIFRRSAVDKKIATRIEQALMRGVGLKAVADDIRENHLLHFHEMETR